MRSQVIFQGQAWGPIRFFSHLSVYWVPLVSVCRGLSDLFASAMPKLRVPFTTSYIYMLHWVLVLPCHFGSPAISRTLLIEVAHTHRSAASLVDQSVKNLPAVQETWAWSLGQEEPLEKEMATHSSILAWRIPSHGQRRLVGYSLWGYKSQTDWVTKPPPPPLSADLLGKWEPRFTPSETYPLTVLSSMGLYF